MDVGSVVEEIDGYQLKSLQIINPLWITEEQREQALVAGYLVIALNYSCYSFT